jgi:hypothetical protein
MVSMTSKLGKRKGRNKDDPRRGETGVVRGSGSGGVEPNPLSGHGGCNRRGSSLRSRLRVRTQNYVS